MTDVFETSHAALATILEDCRQCGACCKHYTKIALEPDEAERIEKLGGFVGRVGRLDRRGTDKGEEQIYMVHPDDKGCIFLHKVDGKYRCKIYHYRPRVCRGFKCNLADSTAASVLLKDAMCLLGLDSLGRKL